MNQDKSFFDRLLEIIAVLLLAVTTLGTAWCGYQASQWSGVQTDDNRIEAEHRLEGNREFGRAIQTISYDTNMVALYAQAVQAGNTGLVQFYRQSLFRPEFLPTLDKWEAQVAAGQAPTPLVQDPEYLDSLRSTYLQAQEQADQAAKDAQQAGDYSQHYVLNTIVLALATLAFAASRVADLPIA